jgi:ABC-type lipoprotein export system ATPase subunit
MFDVATRGGSLVLATHDPEVADRCAAVLDLSWEDDLLAGRRPAASADGRRPAAASG